jgi:excisionase family DNA binding protein
VTDDEQLLTVDQVARQLQVHRATVRRWIKAGKLHGISLGSDRAGWRIRRSEVQALIQGTRQIPLPESDEGKQAA